MARYSSQVMERVRQRLGLEEGDKSRDAEIEAMSQYYVLDHCLCWEGIIGYTQTIIDMVGDVYFLHIG